MWFWCYRCKVWSKLGVAAGQRPHLNGKCAVCDKWAEYVEGGPLMEVAQQRLLAEGKAAAQIQGEGEEA